MKIINPLYRQMSLSSLYRSISLIALYKMMLLGIQAEETTKLKRGIETKIAFAPKNNPQPKYHRKIPTRNWGGRNYRK